MKTTIQERLAKVHFFEVKPDVSALSSNERKALNHCIAASDIMTEIYLKQVYAGNAEIMSSLKNRDDTEGRDLLRYFMLHGTPWDGHTQNEPFIDSVGEKPLFGSFYPHNLTKEEWDSWLSDHPEDRDAFESNYTVIKRQGDRLIAVPYSEEYKDELTRATAELREAAKYLPEGNLRTFLELRADAFLSNDYYESDIAWVDTDGTPFEVTIGPYETYFDNLLGIKASFESFIAVPDKSATEGLSKLTPVVPDFDRVLSDEFNFTPKGEAIPLEVVSDVARGGEARFGSLFVAYNLPNDRRVQEAKGSKKVFSQTLMKVKFEKVGIPIAQRIFKKEDADVCTFDKRLLFILGHEVSHGLGPNAVVKDGRKIPFEVALKDLYSEIEEAKADTLGMRLLKYMSDQGVIEKELFRGMVISEITSFFQGWKRGFSGAHTKSNLIEYNWIKEQGGFVYDHEEGVYHVDTDKTVDAMISLSTELILLQHAGDYERAKAFVTKWRVIPDEVVEIVDRVSDIPTAVGPIWNTDTLEV